MVTRIDRDKADIVVRAVLALEDAKAAEKAATDNRIEAEENVILAVGFVKPEGQETFEASGDAGACEVALKQPISTRVDGEQWRKILKRLPAKHPAREVMETKYELRLKAARELQEKDPRAWAQVSECVTRKPGKVAVEIKWTKKEGS